MTTRTRIFAMSTEAGVLAAGVGIGWAVSGSGGSGGSDSGAPDTLGLMPDGTQVWVAGDDGLCPIGIVFTATPTPTG